MSRERAAPTRPRLLHRLDENAGLVVVWGPTGYGKQALVDSWLATRPAGPVLRTATPRDGARRTYWDHVTELVAAAADDGPGVLVLDRPDLAADSDAWDRLVRIRASRPGLRVIATVCDATLFWDQGLGRLDVTVIGPAELEYTVAEVEALHRSHGLDLPERTVRDHHQGTGGHPALVNLSIDVRRVFGAQIEFETAQATAFFHRAVDRFVESMLTEISSGAIRELAVVLASVGPLSAGAASTLGVEDPENTLVVLERAGLLYRKPRSPSTGWQFPDAIRQSLLRLADRDGIRCPTSTLEGVARWFAANGEPVDALRLATEVQQWDLVADLFHEHWLVIGTVALDVLADTAAVLPDEIARTDAMLYYGRELVRRLASTTPRGTPRLVESERIRPLAPVLNTAHDLEALADQQSAEHAILCCALRTTAHRWRGEFSEAAHHNAQLMRMAVGLISDPRHGAVPVLLPHFCMHLGQSDQFLGNDERAEQFFRLAVDALEGARDGFAGRQTAGHLALLFALRGDIDEAQRWIEREATYGETPGWIGVAASLPAAVASGLVALDRLDLATATAALDGLPDLDDTLEYWVFVEYLRCQHDLVAGRPDVGLDRLGRVTSRFRHWMPSGSLAASLLGAAALDLRVAAGDAAAVAASADGTHPSETLAVARAALATGDLTRAVTLCRTLTADDGHPTRVRMEALLVEATALLGSADETRASVAWTRAMALSGDTGLVRPIAAVPLATRQRLSELGPAAPAVALERAVPIYPEAAPPVRLTERERVVLDALARGERVARIAETLFVSPNTVKTQLRSLYRKLDAHSRDEALATARERGII